jgi:hypothetical protein
MNTLPIYVYITFGLTVLVAVWLFYKAANQSKSFLVLMIVWIVIQSLLAIAGFYNHAETVTKRFPLLLLPPMIFIVLNFVTKKGKQFVDGLNIKMLTLFHIIRIPVEIVLFWLFVHQSVPKAMTFEGHNFDVLSGISAPFIYYFGFVKQKISKPIIIAWNTLCMLLLMNVVANAVLSLPARYQQFGFEQPNMALAYFPFALLPTLLVPLVFFSHFAALRQLFKRQ